MSQISVYTDLILRDQQFKEQLRAMEAEVLASARRIGEAGFKIPLTLDDQFSAQIDGILAKIRAQDVKLTVGLDDEFSAQLASLRAQAATPIRVPLVIDSAVGGAQAAALALPAVAAASVAGTAGQTNALAARGAVGTLGPAAGLDPPSIAAIEEAAAAEARAASTSDAATVAAGRVRSSAAAVRGVRRFTR
jgi:hypothetical protein